MEASKFFSRLLKQPKSTEQVLEVDDIVEFDKAWRSIQDTLEHPDERQLIKGIQSTEVPKNLAHIVDALVHESNQIDEDTLGGCMEYFVNHDLLSNLERLSNQDKPHGIKSEVLKAINNLIVLLPDRFLVHNSVHRPLRRLLRSCIGDQQEDEEAVNGSAKALGAAALEGRGGEVEEDLVDLMCVLCSRMRAYPPLLLIFFHDKGWLHPEHAPEPTSLAPTSRSLSTRPPSTATRGHNFEFLLFSYLLRFIHREGKTGDFARAGLLFLFDIAFHTNALPTAMRKINGNVDDDSLLDARRALAGYISDGDFTDVMAASLGAVWSLLPSKLRVPTLGELGEDTEGGVSSGGMILGADGRGREEKEEDAVRSSTDQDVQEQLGMMIDLFGFLQDTMIRCIPIISDQGGFDTDSDLESDSEIGSSPPKPTPIIQIGMALVDSASNSIQSSFLENVLYPSILECSPQDGSSVAIMTYLDILFANLDDGPLQERLLTFLLPWNQMRVDQDQDMERFTMRDLVVDNIQSGHSQASAAGLRLLKTMMTEHCSASSGRLLEMVPPDYTPDQRIPPKSNEDEMYSSLITQLDPSCQLDTSTSYASYLADTHSTIQSDDCFGRYQYVRSGIENGPPMGKYRFEPDNPMLQILLRSLGRILCQGPDENIALTGVIVTLALCPFRSLEGWLIRENEVDTQAGQTDSTENPFSSTEKKAEPAIFQILSSLTSQIKSFKSRIPNFDTLLSERRQGLLYTDNIDEAMNIMLDVESSSVFGSPTPALPTTPQPKKKGVMGTLASYLTPVRLSSPSNPNGNSPRPGVAPATPQRRAEATMGNTESPYKTHYESLIGQEVEAVPSPIRNGLWASPLPAPSVGSSLKRPGSSVSSRPESSLANTTNTTITTNTGLSDPITLDKDKDNDNDGEGERQKEKEKIKISLSDTLDNCIILEEFIKELVSVIAARKALGIDPVSFL